jgi:hypothetical protein
MPVFAVFFLVFPVIMVLLIGLGIITGFILVWWFPASTSFGEAALIGVVVATASLHFGCRLYRAVSEHADEDQLDDMIRAQVITPRWPVKSHRRKRKRSSASGS